MGVVTGSHDSLPPVPAGNGPYHDAEITPALPHGQDYAL
jgi:hypothetical protein